MDDYSATIAVPQVREILTNYGPVAVLWWDTPTDMTQERAEMLLPLLKLQPGIISNNRLGGGYQRRHGNARAVHPRHRLPGPRLGNLHDDERHLGLQELRRQLEDRRDADPQPDRHRQQGRQLPAERRADLAKARFPRPASSGSRQVGKWMKVNGEAIYGTTASPFKRLAWGRATQEARRRRRTLYLHVFDWPADGKLVVPGLKSPVGKAWLLVDPARNPLTTERQKDDVIISLPSSAPDAVCSVVVLEAKGELDIEPLLPAQEADGSIHLAATDAVCHGEVKYESNHHHDHLGYWVNPADWVEWPFVVNRPGSYTVAAVIAAPASTSFVISVGGSSLAAKSPKTGDYHKFKTVTLGKITLAKPGKVSLAVRAVSEGWRPFNLRSIDLKPAK